MRQIFWIIVLLPSLLFARPHLSPKHPTPGRAYSAWLTGPFLAPTAVNMEVGRPALEPAVTFFAAYGEYTDDWGLKTLDHPIYGINPIVDFQFAITERAGVEILAGYLWNYQNGMSAQHLQDTIVFLGYQVLNDIPHTPVPDFRFNIQTIWPTGKHRNFTPERGIIESTGQGSIFLGPEFAFQKLIWFKENYLALHWSLGASFPITEAKLKGHNTYGGGRGTDGALMPGIIFNGFLSFEYTFNQNWVFASDINLIFQTKTSPFAGAPGLDPEGLPATNGLKTNFELGLTPSLEYNFGPDDGLLFGTWFTVAGKNSFAFVSLFLSYLHVF